MSKKKFGNYGTFEAEGLDEAIKKFCKKKGITGRQFFDRVLGYSNAWWRGVRVNQYGEETELKTICQAIGYDPKKLNFKAGVVNKMAQESRDRARVNYTARQTQEPQKVAKAPEPKETYKQMELSFTDKDLGAKVRECTDDYLVETLGPDRIRALYYLALYKSFRGGKNEKA